MKKIRFVITNNFFKSRDYLIAWNNNITYDSPNGLTWTSWEYFEDCNRNIIANPDLGILTLFKTEEEAESFAQEYNIKEYKIVEILFDF